MSKLNSKKKPSVIEKLKNLCLSLYASRDRIEDNFWENQILQFLQPNFSAKKQKILDQTLDLLQKENSHAYASLMELVENSTQTLCLPSRTKDENIQTLLIASPILAWTSYQIPSGKISVQFIKIFQNAFVNYITAPNTKTIFYRHLFANEDLPESHLGVFQLTKKLSNALSQNKTPPLYKQKITDSSYTFTDIRYVVGLVAAPIGQPLFRWQTFNPNGYYFTQEECLANWRNATQNILSKYFVGCEFKAMLPNAFYSACRGANEEIRSHTITHAVNYLADILKTETQNLRAIIGGFGEETIEEFRIGLTKHGDNKNIYHGIIWPLYQNDEYANNQQINDINELTLEKIKKTLKDTGIKEIRYHPNCFNIDFLEEENHTPLFPNAFGELIFAELPIGQEKAYHHFH